MCLILKNSTPRDPTKRQQLLQAATAMIDDPYTVSFVESFVESENISKIWPDTFVGSWVTWVILSSGLHKSGDPEDHYTLRAFLPDGLAVLTAHVYSDSDYEIYKDGGNTFGVRGWKRLSFAWDCNWLE